MRGSQPQKDLSVTKIKQALLSKIIAEKNTGKMSLFHISTYLSLIFSCEFKLTQPQYMVVFSKKSLL